MRKNEPLQAICEELEARDVPYQIALNRHYKVRFELAGRRHMIAVAVSPSDRRAVQAMRGLVRRLLRA